MREGARAEGPTTLRLRPFNFLRRPALPKPTRGRALTTPREQLLKIGAKAVTHAKYVAFQLAAVAGPRRLFAQAGCFEDLDTWLCKGGLLPAEWRATPPRPKEVRHAV